MRVLYRRNDLPRRGEKARLTPKCKKIGGPSSGWRWSSAAMSSVCLPSSSYHLDRKLLRGLVLLDMERHEMQSFLGHCSLSEDSCVAMVSSIVPWIRENHGHCGAAGEAGAYERGCEKKHVVVLESNTTDIGAIHRA